jgi:hypothetical protein
VSTAAPRTRSAPKQSSRDGQKSSGSGSDATLKALPLSAAAEAAFEERGFNVAASLSPAQKSAFGLAACGVAGALSSSMFTLPQVVVDANAAMCAVLIFVLFSHFCAFPSYSCFTAPP